MAATLALAFARIPEPDLDHIAYSGKPIHRAPEDHALGAVFARLDRDWQPRLATRLARRSRFSFDKAEEALDEELLLLIERRREVFFLETDHWLKLLFVRSKYRLLSNHSASPLASTNALEELLGSAALADANLCVPESPQAEGDAIGVALPGTGEAWLRSQVISALQRFHRYYGRPPLSRECRRANRLPSIATIRRHFGGLEAALVAAGILPTEQGRRRRPWPTVEAARICRWFYRRFGYWPSASDRRRHPYLPSRSVMLDRFGSTHGGEIRVVAEAILSAQAAD
ncbi:MAG TPA: hypothetical protein VGI73_11175 [Solirubrobacterales bacterium]|jgi:hypothetical protein